MIDRLKIKLIETVGRVGAVRRNNYLKSDINYQYNLDNWDRLFEQRQGALLSDEKVLRIKCAYKEAISSNFNRDLYYISNEWIPVYRKNMSQLISALKGDDVPYLGKCLGNFFREKFANGLVGLPINMQRILNRPTKLNKNWYLQDAIYRIQLLKELYPKIDLEALNLGYCGNPYGVIYDGIFVRTNADYQFYIAKRLEELLLEEAAPIVLEIGGGFGGTASFLSSIVNKIKMYIDLDLPETISISTYYLMSLFPDAKFNLYGEDFDPDADFTLYPAFMIERLPLDKIDIAFNSYSFGEMSADAAQNYVDHIGRIKVRKFYHINHTRNSKTSADEIKYSNYQLVDRSQSLWNLGRSKTADEHEYLYVYDETKQ
ncbi:MAG: putative sugar O-methyltransferase [Parvibaculales bacterium]